MYPEQYGPVAQLEERIHGMDEVRGSSPLRSTSFFLGYKFGWYHGKSFRPVGVKGFFVVWSPTLSLDGCGKPVFFSGETRSVLLLNL